MLRQETDPNVATEPVEEEVELTEETTAEEAEPEMDLPAALAKLEEATRKIREVNRESASRRKEIAALKAQITDSTADDEDVATKLADMEAKLAAANEKLRQVDLKNRFESAAVKSKLPFVSPTAIHDAFIFAQDRLDGDLEDADMLDIIKDVVKLRPYLLNKPTPPNINSVEQGPTDALAGLNMDDIARDFGLSNG